MEPLCPSSNPTTHGMVRDFPSLWDLILLGHEVYTTTARRKIYILWFRGYKFWNSLAQYLLEEQAKEHLDVYRYRTDDDDDWPFIPWHIIKHIL